MAGDADDAIGSDYDEEGNLGKKEDAEDFSDVELSEDEFNDDDQGDDEDGMLHNVHNQCPQPMPTTNVCWHSIPIHTFITNAG